MTEVLTPQQRRTTASLGLVLAVLALLAAAAGAWLWPSALRITLIAGLALLAGLLAMLAMALRGPQEEAVLEVDEDLEDSEDHMRFHCSRCNHFTEAPDDGTRPLRVVCTNCGKQGLLE